MHDEAASVTSFICRLIDITPDPALQNALDDRNVNELHYNNLLYKNWSNRFEIRCVKPKDVWVHRWKTKRYMEGITAGYCEVGLTSS